MSGFLLDLRYAARALRATPALTLASILVLALAIAATITVWGLVWGVLLRPLPFPDADRLVMLWQRAPGVGVAEDWFSPAQYFDLAESVESLDAIAILSGSEMTLQPADGDPQRVGVLHTSASLFDVLGISPAHGRRIRPDDDAPGSPRVAVASASFYRRHFGDDPDRTGQTLELDGTEVTVVGVLPEMVLDADLLPTLSTVARFDILLSMPLVDPGITTRGSENYNIVARVTSADSQLENELLRTAATFSDDPGALAAGLEPGTEYHIAAVRLIDQIVGPVRTPLLVLLFATTLLLAVACTNVANLVMVRAASERRAVAIRAALGAPAHRLLAQELWRSLLLAAGGGVIGVFLAVWALEAIQAAAPVDLPRFWDVRPDGPVLGAALASVLLTALAAGWLPALRASGVDPGRALRRGHRGGLGHGSGRWMVAGQVAAAVVLVVGAGLLLRTLGHLQGVDPGFEPDGALTFRVALVGERYVDRATRVAFFRELDDRLVSRSEVAAFGAVSRLPMTRGFAWTDFTIAGEADVEGGDRMVADVQTVTPGIFAALGTPFLAGRDFLDSDGVDPPPVVVDRAFAERFWSTEEAIGNQIGNDFIAEATIVGVVESIRQYGLDEAPRPTVYFPHARNGSRSLYGVVRGAAPLADLLGAVRDSVRAIDPSLPVHAVRGLDAIVASSLERRRIVLTLLAYLAGVAVALAVIGLYGVLSFTVTRETRDLAVRKSLGAQRRDLVRLVMGRATLVVAAGLGTGVALAVAGSRLLGGLIYGVSGNDPVALVGAVAVVGALALITALAPALRAARTDPIQVLRDS